MINVRTKRVDSNDDSRGTKRGSFEPGRRAWHKILGMGKITISLAAFVMGIFATLYGLIMHHYLMSVTGNYMIHSLLMGSLFGLINSFVFFGFFSFYKKEKSINKRLESKIRMDSLTGLFNRYAFDKDIKQIDSGDFYSMLFIDVDNFKEYNDQYGHQLGDDVLKFCGTVIKASIRYSDSAYRYGGDEMVVLLHGCGKKEAEKIAGKIMYRCNSENEFNTPVSLSIGIASMSEDVNSIDNLIKACDSALYMAKEHGKNKIYVFSKKDT